MNDLIAKFTFRLVLVLSLTVNLRLSAQSVPTTFDPNKKIPVEELRADFKLLRSVLEDVHPGLYWYTSKSKMDLAFRQTYRSLKKPLTEQEFMNILYPLLCQIRCGHTQISHSQEYRAAPNRPKLVHLPFDIFVQGKRAWITVNNSSDSTLTPGSDLLEINQVACSNIITAGLNWWNGDGYQVTWKEFFLNEYDFFEDVCWAVFNLEGPYHLKIKDVQGNIRSVTVTNQPAKIARSPSANQNLTSEQQEKARKSKYLHLKLLHDSVTAVLTVNGLEYGDEEYYQQYFSSLNKSKIKNLILDVRRNPGGDVRIISSLMSYLADSSYQIIKKIIAKKPDPTQNNYTAYFNPSITRSHKAGYLTGQKEGNWYAIGTSAEIGKIIGYTPKAKKDNFKGNLYVLIGGGTFSNAANFTAALKVYRKNVVFIGSETGGTELGCGGGTNQELTLPHSKVVVTIPLMRLISASSNPKDGRGLIPDVEVLYTPEAITQKQDLELEKALQIIDSRSTSGK